MVNRRPVEIAGKFYHTAAVGFRRGGFCGQEGRVGTPLTPGPSPAGRGGLPFYIDGQDGQDFGPWFAAGLPPPYQVRGRNDGLQRVRVREQSLFKVPQTPLMVSLSNHRRPSFDRLRTSG